jgi:hypothetical protein
VAQARHRTRLRMTALYEGKDHLTMIGLPARLGRPDRW